LCVAQADLKFTSYIYIESSLSGQFSNPPAAALAVSFRTYDGTPAAPVK
jgi:hypothetical protein